MLFKAIIKCTVIIFVFLIFFDIENNKKLNVWIVKLNYAMPFNNVIFYNLERIH